MNASHDPSSAEFDPASPDRSSFRAKPGPYSDRRISGPGLSGPYPLPSSESVSVVELRPVVRGVGGGMGWPTARDVAIIQALDSYRYMDRRQIEALFFVGPRSCQYRLRWLLDHGFVDAWSVRVHPRRGSRPSIYFLSSIGARALAEGQDMDPAPFIQRAKHARTRRFFLEHDLRANQFFVDLCDATRERPDYGVYQWVGPVGVRAAYAEEGEQGPIPDGWARLLIRDREALLHLEWDQGTEARSRVRRKFAAYVAYFTGRREASCNHVLFVVPTSAREAQVHRAGSRLLGHSPDRCHFWTTHRGLLGAVGALGAAWREVGGDDERSGLTSMTTRLSQAGPVEDAIGKPGWWERRPGGGEGA